MEIATTFGVFAPLCPNRCHKPECRIDRERAINSFQSTFMSLSLALLALITLVLALLATDLNPSGRLVEATSS